MTSANWRQILSWVPAEDRTKQYNKKFQQFLREGGWRPRFIDVRNAGYRYNEGTLHFGHTLRQVDKRNADREAQRIHGAGFDNVLVYVKEGVDGLNLFYYCPFFEDDPLPAAPSGTVYIGE